MKIDLKRKFTIILSRHVDPGAQNIVECEMRDEICVDFHSLLYSLLCSTLDRNSLN